jgi:O-antigen ligase
MNQTWKTLPLEHVRQMLISAFVITLFFPGWVIVTLGGSGIQIAFLVLFVVCGFALIEFISNRTIQIKRSQWVVLLLLSIATLSVLQSANAPTDVFPESPQNKSIRQLVYLYAGALVFFCVPYLVRSKEDVQRAVSALFWGGWLAIIYAIFELAMYAKLIPWFSVIDHAIRNNPSYPMAALHTLYGIIPQINSFAPEPFILVMLLAPSLGLALARITDPSLIRRKRDYALPLGLVAIYLFSFSRIGMAILVVVFVVAFWITFQQRQNSRLLIGALALVLGLAIAAFLMSSTGRRDDTPPLLGIDNSIYTRTVTLLVAARVWIEHPLGIGWGTFAFYFPAYVQPYLRPNAIELFRFIAPEAQAWVPIHNTFLRIGAELGIQGFIVFGAFILLIGASSWRAIRSTNRPSFLIVGISAAFVSLLVAGLSADWISFGMSWFTLAFAQVVCEIYAPNHPSRP